MLNKGASNLAKLTPPCHARVYNRTRLFKQLDDASDNPVIWISAPAGSGKTTLVTSYFNEKDIAPLWYQVDEGDADIASFFYYLGILVKQVAPKTNKELPLLTPEYLLGLKTFTRNFFREFFSNIKSPCTLVLDNFQDAGSESQLHEIIPIILEEIPNGISIIIISRQDPPSSLARFQISKELKLFKNSDIRLELSESIEIGKVYENEKNFSDDTYEIIHKYTHGWTAGVVLFVENSQEDQLTDSFNGSENQQTIFDYFTNEIFVRTSQDGQEFLIKTALFPEIDAMDACTLTGESNSKQILDKLCKDNSFTTKREGTNQTYVYHPLFRDFLRKKANSYYTSDDLAEHQITAAQLLEQQGHYDEAAKLYITIKDWKKLTVLLIENAQQILEKGKWQTVQRWLKPIPQNVIENEPWLLFWQATSKLPLSLTGARDDYKSAYHLFFERNDAAGAYLSWAGAVDTFFYIWIDFYPLDYWIEEFEKLKKKFPDIPSLDIEARVTYAIFGALVWRQPEKDMIHEWCLRAKIMLEKPIDLTLKLMTGNLLTQYYIWWRGDLSSVRASRKILTNISNEENVSTLAKLMWSVMDCTYLSLNNEIKESDLSTNNALELSKSSGVYHTDFLLNISLVYTSLINFDAVKTSYQLQKVEAQLHDVVTFDNAHYHYVYAWYAMSKGMVKSAKENASEALDKAKKVGGSNYEVFGKLTLSMALVENGEYADAEKLMEEVYAWGKNVGNNFIECQYYMVKAYIAFCCNDESTCLTQLKIALLFTKQQNYIVIPWIGCLPVVLAKLYRLALIHDIETDYVAKVITKRQLRPPAGLSIPETWPFPIKIYTLGTFKLVLNNERVVFKGKSQKKPIELLKTIVAYGAKDINVHHLADILWPDAEGDSAYQSFTMALKRLRELLNKKEALILSDGKLSIDPRYVWLDLWALEKSTQQDDIMQLQKALNLYQGAFLKNDDASWAIHPRDQLQTKIVNIIVRLGEHYQKDHKWQDAILVYQRGLQVDPLFEDFYLGLMHSYINVDKKTEAIKHYLQCKDIFIKELNILPSNAIINLYKSII